METVIHMSLKFSIINYSWSWRKLNYHYIQQRILSCVPEGRRRAAYDRYVLTTSVDKILLKTKVIREILTLTLDGK